MERTLPYSENKACTVSSVASLGKFPTKIRFKRHVLNKGGELIGRVNRICHNPAYSLNGVGCWKVRRFYAALTCDACGPLGPDSTSYLTAWPSANVR